MTYTQMEVASLWCVEIPCVIRLNVLERLLIVSGVFANRPLGEESSRAQGTESAKVTIKCEQ